MIKPYRIIQIHQEIKRNRSRTWLSKCWLSEVQSVTDAVTEQTLMRLKEHGGQASAAVFVAAEGLGFEVL